MQFKPPILGDLKYFDKLKASCGHCIACKKLNNIKHAVQLYCEMHTTDTPCYFVTLTYDDKNLPANYSVNMKHLQAFIRAVRDNQRNETGKATLRYQGQGENGGETSRPHYHLATFGLTLTDLEVYAVRNLDQATSYNIYESEYLQKFWEYGSLKINELTMPNCIYIASHHLDEKILKRSTERMRSLIHPVTQKILFSLADEFTIRSTCPGLGFDYYQTYKDEIFVHGSVIINGRKMPVPAYFSKLYKAEYPDLYEQYVQRQLLKIKDVTSDRLIALENYQDAIVRRSRYK